MCVGAFLYRIHEDEDTKLSRDIRGAFEISLKFDQWIIVTMKNDLPFELQLPFEDRKLRVGLVLAMKRNKLWIDVEKLVLMTPEEASKYAVKIDAKDAELYGIDIDLEYDFFIYSFKSLRHVHCSIKPTLHSEF